MQLGIRQVRTSGPKRLSPFYEMGGRTRRCGRSRARTFKALAERFARRPGSVPSDFVPRAKAEACASFVKRRFAEAGVERFGVRGARLRRVPGAAAGRSAPRWHCCTTRAGGTWPPRRQWPWSVLAGRRHRVWLARGACGARAGGGRFTRWCRVWRQASTRAVHEAAMRGRGDARSRYWAPRSLACLSEKTTLPCRNVSRHSFWSSARLPLKRYESQDYRRNRGLFFPSETPRCRRSPRRRWVVEAGETSGTLIQARAALAQGRKLLLLDSCFRNPGVTWPARFVERGAVRVRTYDDIQPTLSATPH